MSDKSKKPPDENGRLDINPFPADVLERVKALASFVGMERNKFVIEFLRQETEWLELTHEQAKTWWQARLNRKRGKSN